MSQNLHKKGVRSGTIASDSDTQSKTCQTLPQAFYHDVISLYPDDELLADLQSLSIVERSTRGMKLEARRNSSGHADTAFAFVMALQLIKEQMQEE